GAPCLPLARPRSAPSCWPRDPRYAGAMWWSERRPGCNRDRWPDTSREPRDCNNDCRRAARSGCWATDRPQQAAQEGADLFATRPFGGAKHSCDEAALAVEHDDRLKAIFVVMRIEEPQLLSAMNRIERVVNVERDPFWDLPERLAIKIDHGAAHAQQGASIRQVLQPRDGRLRTQFAVRGSKVMRHLEYRIGSQGTGIIAVCVACRDHQQSKTDDVSEAVCDLIR